MSYPTPIFVFPCNDVALAIECAKRWQSAGYGVRIASENEDMHSAGYHTTRLAAYNGYAAAVSEAAFWCGAYARLANGEEHTLLIFGGHDQHPDPHREPGKLAEEYWKQFGCEGGVMQPTGDGFAGNGMACVSPWIGGQWLDAYGPFTPYCTAYFHFNCDVELHRLANLRGHYWAREDVSQHHAHWTREANPVRPELLAKAEAMKAHDSALLKLRTENNFPGFML